MVVSKDKHKYTYTHWIRDRRAIFALHTSKKNGKNAISVSDVGGQLCLLKLLFRIQKYLPAAHIHPTEWSFGSHIHKRFCQNSQSRCELFRCCQFDTVRKTKGDIWKHNPNLSSFDRSQAYQDRVEFQQLHIMVHKYP